MKPRTMLVLSLIAVFAVVAATSSIVDARGGGSKHREVVFVTGQNLYYDTIIGPNLPQHGPFQLLVTGVGPTGLETEYGPGDPGYVGGRWWVDANGNGEQDSEDAYFSCPLLGPGRETP